MLRRSLLVLARRPLSTMPPATPVEDTIRAKVSYLGIQIVAPILIDITDHGSS
jgi:hypothetical protein